MQNFGGLTKSIMVFLKVTLGVAVLWNSTGNWIRKNSGLVCHASFVVDKVSVISDVRVTWERVSQKLNILMPWRRGPRVSMG